jgi:hypothetical protein
MARVKQFTFQLKAQDGVEATIDRIWPVEPLNEPFFIRTIVLAWIVLVVLLAGVYVFTESWIVPGGLMVPLV